MKCIEELEDDGEEWNMEGTGDNSCGEKGGQRRRNMKMRRKREKDEGERFNCYKYMALERVCTNALRVGSRR